MWDAVVRPGVVLEAKAAGWANLMGNCKNYEGILMQLDRRFGPVHAKQSLARETAHEAQAFGQGLNFLHGELVFGPAPSIRRRRRHVEPLFQRFGARTCPQPALNRSELEDVGGS
jgi:hypothetical protein